jgi:hypothetical protein
MDLVVDAGGNQVVVRPNGPGISQLPAEVLHVIHQTEASPSSGVVFSEPHMRMLLTRQARINVDSFLQAVDDRMPDALREIWENAAKAPNFTLESVPAKLPTESEVLKHASKYGLVGAVRVLLHEKSDWSRSDINYRMWDAANNGHAEIVELLANHPQATPEFLIENYAHKWGNGFRFDDSAFRYSPMGVPEYGGLFKKQSKVMQVLARHPRFAQKARQEGHEMEMAILTSDTDELRNLVSAKPGEAREYHLVMAADVGNFEAFKVLTQVAGLAPSSESFVFARAAASGNLEMVTYLVSNYNPAQVPFRPGLTILQESFLYAARYDHPHILDYLVNSHGIDPSADSNKALIEAGDYGSARAVDYLLNNPLVRDSLGRNVIVSAASNGVEIFTTIAAKFDQVPPEAFVEAAKYNAVENMEVMVNMGLDPAANQNRAVNMAVQERNDDAVSFLVNQPAVRAAGLSPAVIAYCSENDIDIP